MAGISKIMHKAREIIYLNYQGLSENEIVECLKEAERIILADNKPYYTLTNFNGAFATKKVMEQAAILGHKTQHLAIKSAIVGAVGAKSVMLKSFNKVLASGGLTPFEDEESAKDFLVKHLPGSR